MFITKLGESREAHCIFSNDTAANISQTMMFSYPDCLHHIFFARLQQLATSKAAVPLNPMELGYDIIPSIPTS